VSHAAWLTRQSLPRDAFELVLGSNGADPAVERDVADLLRPCDRVLIEHGANRSRLYDLGARAARGGFLFLTESHCHPEPDCLAELDRFLRTTGHVGACCRSVGHARRFHDHLDLLMFEEGFHVFTRAGDWRKVSVHGFTLRRPISLEVGGLPIFAVELLPAPSAAP
jgi:hypothetical protein